MRQEIRIIDMGKGSKPVCRVCFELFCVCKKQNLMTNPAEKQVTNPAEKQVTNPTEKQPVLKIKDPFLIRIQEALEKPEDNCEFIDALKKSNKVYEPHIQDEIDPLLVYTTNTEPKTSKVPFNLRKQKLSGIVIIKIIEDLRKFQKEWAEIITYEDSTKDTKSHFEFFKSFVAKSALNKITFYRGFNDGPWGKTTDWDKPNCTRVHTENPRDKRGNLVRSPYFKCNKINSNVSKNEPNGSNSWLDRFLSARNYFLTAYDDLCLNININININDNNILRFTLLKHEFSALFALAFGTLPLYDPSHAGQINGKWKSVRGTFVYWTSETEYKLLSDPDNLHKSLNVKNDLIKIGQYLTQLPGSFPDFFTKIESTITTLHNKQIFFISQFIADDNIFFTKTKEEKEDYFRDKKKEYNLRDKEPLKIMEMNGLRPKDVITMSLDDDYINKALKIHGLILPSDLSLTLVDKKEILFILLLE